MEYKQISALTEIPQRQKDALIKGGLSDVSDILLTPANEISRRSGLLIMEVQTVVAAISGECVRIPRYLEEVESEGQEMFTSGDPEMDSVIGGGIRTGMIWELVGESAAGKTQLALQFSQTVQLPRRLGGLTGSSCYLTISSKLQTTRMEQLMIHHPLLSPALCSLSNVHTISVPTMERLLYVLSSLLPQLIERTRSSASSMPVKLIVIDALAELFHDSPKTSTQTLVERSRNISEISSRLRSLASQHRIAVLVLNEVIDVFDRSGSLSSYGTKDVLYRQQSRWFGRADSIPGEDKKEASLGLVWANQTNVRIMLSRTGRRRHLDEMEDRRNKLPKTTQGLVPITQVTSQTEMEPVLIRRLSVIFSSVSSPMSCDYIVTAGGVRVLPNTTVSPQALQVFEENVVSSSGKRDEAPTNSSNSDPSASEKCLEISPFDIGFVEDTENEEVDLTSSEHGPDDDEWTDYWKQNDLQPDVYTSLDVDPTSSQSNT